MEHRSSRALLAPGALLIGLAMVLTLQSPTIASSATKPTPGHLVVTATTPTTASLAWQRVSGASAYRVHYATSSNMTHARSAAFRYSNGVVQGLKPATRYWFQVAVAPERGNGAALSRYTTAPYPSAVTRETPTAQAPPGSPTGKPADITVMSWNISSMSTDNYAGTSGSAQEGWAAREPVVVRQILGLAPTDQKGTAPDVINLQEANNGIVFNRSTQYQDLVKQLNASAPSGVHYSTIGAANGALDSGGTRIVYNDRSLTLRSTGMVKWVAQETSGYRYMPWAILESNANHSLFFDSSNHLDSVNSSVRQRQWTELRSKVPSLANGLPIITSGDFNSPRLGTGTNLTEMVSAGFGDVMGQVNNLSANYVSASRAKTVVNGNFNSYNGYQRTLHAYPSNKPSVRVGQTIDYIFASNNLAVQSFEMVLDRTKSADDLGTTLRGTIPSDHNMIRAVIRIP